MESQLSDLKKFTESFFKTLGANITWSGESLHVSSVPSDFESFFGKPGPYTLVFEQGLQGELVARGSFLLKLMTSFIENRGQTAIIKLVFDYDYLEALRRYFSCKGCEIVSVSKTPTHIPLYQFVFSSKIQYLNEKEQVLTSLIVNADGAPVSFNLAEYASVPGNAQELGQHDVKVPYSRSRDAVRERIMPRLTELSTFLSERLKLETDRIEQHYARQQKEHEISRERLNEQLHALDKLPSSPSTIQKRMKLLESLKQYDSPERIEAILQEKTFLLKDETLKHALNVDTKLVNTTVIYYPHHVLSVTLKNKDVARSITLTYNPLKNEFIKPLCCECCNREIREITLCSSSHVSCTSCCMSCRGCNRSVCSLCAKKLCVVCAKTLCKRCVSRCSTCWKDACLPHLKTNYATGSEGCTRCLKPCSKCGSYADVKHLSEGVCLKCARITEVFRKT
jgi:hypothetical protein